MGTEASTVHECPQCGREFDSAMGVKVHQGHMRGKLRHGRKPPVRAVGRPKHGPVDRKFSWHTYEGPGPCNWQADDGRYCGAPEDHRWHRR